MTNSKGTGRVALITGASSGIGLALAYEMTQRGFAVALVARNEQALRTVSADLQAQGHKAFYVVADVAKRADCENAVASTIKHFGRLDVLVNNAGISMRALLADCDPEVISRVMDVNFFGTMHCTMAALPELLRRRGSVVGISSIAGLVGLPARAGYSASKFAMHGFLQSLRIENRLTGLHVMLACPGFTRSAIRERALNAEGASQTETPLDEAKLMSAEEVARRVADGIEGRKRQLIMTRQGKLTAMLSRLAPAMLEGLVFKHFANEKDSPLAKDK